MLPVDKNNPDIFLDVTKKVYYMQDFQNVRANTFMPLDKDVEPFLVSINENPVIQTLYSKKCTPGNWADDISYIQFCYYEKLEKKIFRDLIPSLFILFSEQEYKLTYHFNYPSHNPNFKSDTKPTGIGCFDNKDYFFINHIKLQLNSLTIHKHDEFWQTITDKLANIGKQ